MSLLDSWASSRSLHVLLDHIPEAALLFDRQGRLSYANSAALATLPCEPGMRPAEMNALLGMKAATWLKRACASGVFSEPPPSAELQSGLQASLTWHRLDANHGVLHIKFPTSAPEHSVRPVAPPQVEDTNQLLHVFWHSHLPLTLQGLDQRLLDVNSAFEHFSAYPRAALVGLDPLELHPARDQAILNKHREMMARGQQPAAESSTRELCLVGGDDRERWYKPIAQWIRDGQGQRVLLTLWQDKTAEHLARERAERSMQELGDWFDLSPVGAVMFEVSGLLVRSNRAFVQLAGERPKLMSEASPALQRLMAWGEGDALTVLEPQHAPLVREGWLNVPHRGARRFRACIRAHLASGRQKRYMAVLEDRSVEEERDLVQSQLGALMDTVGVGLATFAESTGWVAQGQIDGQGGAREALDGRGNAAMQAISREVVESESLPEYERLQQALKHGQRAEVRFAIRHPELGQRWLLTRVEPATLASGKRTTSVVTLDVTEHQRSQQRSEQLLGELSTILESSSAGIAYFRAGVLLRCNQRFRAMLAPAGLSARQGDEEEEGAIQLGQSLLQVFGPLPQSDQLLDQVRLTLDEGLSLDTEIAWHERQGVEPERESPTWYSMSFRRSQGATQGQDAVVVVSDVSWIKAQQLQLELVARDRELMFSLSDVGIAFLREGRIQRANLALAQWVGANTEALVGREEAALFIPDESAAERRAQEEAELLARGRFTGEVQLMRADGRPLWVQVSRRLVQAQDPSAGVIASYVNVDDRYRAEQAMALQAERTKAILDSVLVGIVTVGAGGIEWMNRSARRMFGGDLADFINLPISTVATDEDDHPFRQTRYLSELVEGQAETFECQVLARDGRRFWVVGNAVATGREQRGRQLTYALLDIERRRQAEASTAQAQASLARLIDAAPLAIALVEAPSLNVLQTNAVAEELLGCTEDQSLGRPMDQILPAERQAVAADMRLALQGHALVQREYAWNTAATRLAEPTQRIWDARYLPLSSPDGHNEQLLLVASDVTAQRVAQEARLEAALAQRDMLVKEVHHRIKNNLQGVAGLMQQIAQRRPEVADVIAEVVGQVQAIAQVYGLQVGATGPLRVKSVVEAITHSVQRTFGRPIHLELQGSAMHRWALPEHESIPIALTINELLTNAIKHSPSLLPVGCTLLASEDGVMISIANDGHLKAGFSLAQVPGGVSGLGLVRALLPRRHASLSLTAHGATVVAQVKLEPPVVSRLEPL